MIKFGSALLVFLCSMTLLCAPAIGAGAPVPPAVQAGTDKPIPIQILGKTLEIRKGMTRADAKAALSAIIKDEASLDNDERLQYDVVLVPNSAPVAIFFDFDKKGVVSDVTIDAMQKEQNPAVTKLVEWLKANAGKPTVKKKVSTWVFAGWKIEHEAGGSGEDAAYRATFSRVK